MTTYLKSRWERLVRRRDTDSVSTLKLCDQLFDEVIVAKYFEEHRKYHDLNHIDICLGYFDKYHPDYFDISKTLNLQLAIFFHDIVYNPKSNTNELDSVVIMKNTCDLIGFHPVRIMNIADMIMATMHSGSVSDMPEQTKYLVDIDLAILGETGSIFDQYDKLIAQEYNWVPPRTYRLGRARVLQGFLDRERIYNTDPFFEQFELQARKNLRRKINELKGKDNA